MRIVYVLIFVFLGAYTGLTEPTATRTDVSPTKTLIPSVTPMPITPTRTLTRGEDLFAIKHASEDFDFFFNGITVFEVILEVGLPDRIYYTSGGFAEYYVWDLTDGTEVVVMVMQDDDLIGNAWVELGDSEWTGLFQYVSE